MRKLSFRSFLAPVGELANCLMSHGPDAQSYSHEGRRQLPNVFGTPCFSYAQHTPWIFDNMCLKSNSILYWLSFKLSVLMNLIFSVWITSSHISTDFHLGHLCQYKEALAWILEVGRLPTQQDHAPHTNEPNTEIHCHLIP